MKILYIVAGGTTPNIGSFSMFEDRSNHPPVERSILQVTGPLAVLELRKKTSTSIQRNSDSNLERCHPMLPGKSSDVILLVGSEEDGHKGTRTLLACARDIIIATSLAGERWELWRIRGW